MVYSHIIVILRMLLVSLALRQNYHLLYQASWAVARQEEDTVHHWFQSHVIYCIALEIHSSSGWICELAQKQRGERQNLAAGKAFSLQEIMLLQQTKYCFLEDERNSFMEERMVVVYLIHPGKYFFNSGFLDWNGLFWLLHSLSVFLYSSV